MRKGFTLVEILVSAGIMATIVSVVFAVLEVGDMSGRQDLGLIDLQQQARLSMDGMTREIRQSKASDISISSPGPGNGAAIAFKIPGSAYCFKYSLSGNQIRREILDCLSSAQLAQAVIANDIDTLNFSLSQNLVQIRLGAAKTVKNRRLCFPSPCEEPAKLFTEKVRLRN